MSDKPSYPEKIKNHLKHVYYNGTDDGWVFGYKLQSTNLIDGWVGCSGKRECRRLAANGEIEKRYAKQGGRKMVQYRHKAKQGESQQEGLL